MFYSLSKAMRLQLMAVMAVLPLLFSGQGQICFGVSGGGEPAVGEAAGIQEAFIGVAERVKPAVVNISTVYVEKYQAPQYEFYFGSPFEDFFNEFFGENRPQRGAPQPKERYYQRKYEGTGSGVIISREGYILTNEHVVREAKEIKVTLSDEKTYKGKVVGKDSQTDIAVIKISAGEELPFAKLGDSDRIRVGEWAIAIGSPFGLEETVTSGIISAKRQSLSIEGREYRNLIQTDAAINRGNSGGPLCNIKGEVIGINSAIYAPTGVFSGIGFAIPINNAKNIMEDLIHKGKVVRGWLGVEIRPVDGAIAKQFNLPDKNGAMVNNVLEGSPAAKAGLMRGDIIREFDGKKIDDVRKLQDVVSRTEPKKKVQVRVFRGRKEIPLQLVMGEMPSEEKMASKGAEKEESAQGEEPAATFDWEGLKAANIDENLSKQFEIPSGEKGCAVIDVQQGSIAEEIGFLRGDLVRSVNQAPTPSLNELRSVMKKVKLSEGVVFDINRQGRLLYLSYSQQ